MLHFETVESGTLGLLKQLMESDIFRESRLVGGTALALQLGHRKSVDLDLFGCIDATSDELSELYASIGVSRLLSTSRNINVFTVDGVKVDSVNYRYPWLGEPVVCGGIRLAALKDIAAMKMAAIINRGTKKDFIDMYFLLRRYSLDEILGFYMEKYVDGTIFIALKSLVYFVDAESDPMPYMFEDVSWEEVKDFISEAVQGGV